MKELTAQRLRQLFKYEPEIGNFIRLKNATRSDLVGKIAGTLLKNGYVSIHVDGAAYLAHRLAFLYETGHWPSIHTDHRNGVRNDNRWLNLRDATRSQNNQNSKRKGRRFLKGVELATDPRRLKPYSARICANGKRHSLGYFSTEIEAHAAYCEAATRLHGEFARAA